VTYTNIAQAFFKAYTDHDLKAMVNLCTSDAMFRYIPLGDSGAGSVREAGVSTWQLYIDAFPNFKSEVKRVIDCGDTVVCEVVNSGTQAKAVGNIQSKGRSFAAPHLYILDFEQGQIKNIICYWDNDMIYAQLGHTETHQ